MRVTGRALTHASPYQRVLVLAHFSSEPTERAGQLFPEAPVVGQVSRAALRFGDVLARPGGAARLRVFAFDRQHHRVPDVSRPPRALHLALDGELPPGGLGSTLLTASTAGHGDLLSEEDQQQQAQSAGPERPHVAWSQMRYHLKAQRMAEEQIMVPILQIGVFFSCYATIIRFYSKVITLYKRNIQYSA